MMLGIQIFSLYTSSCKYERPPDEIPLSVTSTFLFCTLLMLRIQIFSLYS